MKTTRIQFNATTFKATRNIISAYFGAKFDLAIKLDDCKRRADGYAKVMATDRADLASIAMGETEGIVRTAEEIRKSLATNKANYDKIMKPYNDLRSASDKAIADAVKLFDDAKSELYTAYSNYVTEPTDDNYNAYADAMAKKFVGFGLADATAENVAHYMPNGDRELRGKTAVKNGKIVDAFTSKVFAHAVLRKIYDNNKNEFSSAKFVKYCEKIKADAEKNK